MIERINEQIAYNPVREHINIGFEVVLDKELILETIASDLLLQGFDPVLSRVLVFARTRKATEEIVEALIDCLSSKNIPWAEKAGFFHAGMDSTDRESTYEDFKSGDKVILVATKAFGMGMDIPNIHYVYHYRPSSTFEDFLQEVGRAGRNKEKLEQAGFSNENPIKTKCILTKDDFRELQDLNHKGNLSWSTIKEVQKVLFDYISKFQPVVSDPQKAFPLPFDLLNSYPQFEDEFDKDGTFRLALYWLERLGRIRLGMFTPAFLPLRISDNDVNYSIVKSSEERKELLSFVEAIKSYKANKFPVGNSVMLPMTDLQNFSGKRTHSELFRFLTLAQKSKAVTVDRYITLEPTELRVLELDKWTSITNGPTIEAVFAAAEKVLNRTKYGEQLSISGDFLDSLILEVCDEYFPTNKVFWNEYKKKSKNEIAKEKIAEKLKKDFATKRVKFAFKLITMLPKMRHQSIIEVAKGQLKGEVVNLIYNGNKNKQEWQKPLERYKKDLTQFIYQVAQSFTKSGSKSINYTDLVIKLGLEEASMDYLPNLIFISKGLGYFKGEGSLIPMGVELFIDDTSEIKEEDRSTKDYQVHKDFQEGLQFKELRLLALECLGDISKVGRGETITKAVITKQDTFIKNFFKSSSSAELISLLVDHFGENHPNLKAFRKEALLREEAKLNQQQKAVYDAPIDTNLQVIAGPGSGKTHTLTLRVARLIQNEQVSPDQILILAYNRAVVVELKDRLAKLFKELGYNKLISRLKVFTFHGFCQYCLENELEGVEFDKWVPRFINKLNTNPGRITQKLGLIRYVFVDEFQDITNNRLELLEKIANPQRTTICVIGDPNQSIYGYERVNEGGTMSPKSYYDDFSSIYKPKELFLNVNYRSLPNILLEAEKLLRRNTPEFEIPQLIANRTSQNDKEYCEIINRKEVKIDWKEKLKELLVEEFVTGKKYQQVAIMYRRNEEVFRAFNELQNLKLPSVRIRIQGASSSPYRSREFFHFLQIFKEKSTTIVPSLFIDEFLAEKKNVLALYSNWDTYLINLLHCILVEFLVEKSDDSTYQDLIDFIEDLTGRDEGHYAKIFDKHINVVDSDSAVQEIVITTMHKVKGIEFDAVIIPPSFSDFPMKEEADPAKLKELVEEERRLLYVAYTRARYRLVVLKYDREIAIDEGRGHRFPEEIRKQLGVIVPQEIDKLFISWGAREDNLALYNNIRYNVAIGDGVFLTKDLWNNWYANSGDKILSRIKAGKVISPKSKLEGFAVSSILVYTYKESIDYDLKHGTTYTKDNWGNSAIERGYIYLADFSGFGK